jgi:broad specificity phosphatase PhoE
VLRSVDRIAAAHGNGDDVLIVAHGGVISALLAHWLGLPLSSIWRLAVANCSLTEIAPPRVVSMNETGHLREVNVVVTEPLSP